MDMPNFKHGHGLSRKYTRVTFWKFYLKSEEGFPRSPLQTSPCILLTNFVATFFYESITVQGMCFPLDKSGLGVGGEASELCKRKVNT